MNEVPFDVLIKKAETCYHEKMPWHFHILTPVCTFNERDTFVIIFEDETSGERMCATFGEKPLQQGAQLEKLFYGRV